MATYTKETALYDTGAIAEDIGAAGETASKYITTVTGGGIKVHPENNTTDYVQIDGDSLDIYSGGQDVASYGAVSRIGSADESHINISGNSISAIASSGNEYFNVSENGGAYTELTYALSTSLAVNGQNLDNAIPISGSAARTKWTNLASGGQFRVRCNAVLEYTESGQKKTVSLEKLTSFANKGTQATILEWTYGNKRIVRLVYNGATNYNAFGLTTIGTTTVSGVTYTFKQLKLYLGTNETTTAPLYKFGADMPESGGNYSFLMGKGTVAPDNYQLAVGKYNESNSDAAFIIGNGSDDGNRSNVFDVTWSGKADISGASGQIIGYQADCTNGASVFFGVGQSGTAHGVYSNTDSRWLVHSNNGGLYLGGTIFKNLFVIETHAYKTNNLSITSGSSLNGTLSITKSGYVPVAISGWRGSNGTSGGGGGSRINPYALYLSASAVGSGTITIGLSAIGGAVTNCSFTVDVLWIKNI